MVNTLIRALNTIQVKIPDWVPLFGGKQFGIDIPEIPLIGGGAASAHSWGKPIEQGRSHLEMDRFVANPVQGQTSGTVIITVDGLVLAAATNAAVGEQAELEYEFQEGIL